ncbi:MAG: type II toxin-antitoxin system ParD family antitoxin [Candidatus Scalindua sp.]
MMSKNTSIALGEHFQDFIKEQVTQGRYGSTSEVIRAGLRLLEDHSTKLTALRNAIKDGIDSGPAESFDVDDFLSSRHRGTRNG